MSITVPLRHVAQVWASNVDKLSSDGETPIQLCNYTDAYKNDVIRPHAGLMRATARPDEISRFHLEVGDIVLTKDSEDPSDIGISAYVAETAPDFVCGYHLAIARPHEGTHGRYLCWALRSQPALDHFTNNSNGISRYGLSSTGLASTPVPFPSQDTQRRIADFLDDRVARIDQSIAARRHQATSITLAVDSEWEALTTALTTDEWIPIRRFFGSIADGPFGSSLTSAHYTDSGTRVIRLGNLGLADFRDTDKAYISNEYAAKLKSHAVTPGDLLMAGLGDERWPLGRCTVAPEGLGPAIVKADCYRIRLDGRVSHEYAAAVLSSPRARALFALAARGATRARLNTDLARAATLPFLPASAQGAYADAVKKVQASASDQISQLTRVIDLLNEYKQSLIAAAVAGEFDVTTATTKIPEF